MDVENRENRWDEIKGRTRKILYALGNWLKELAPQPGAERGAALFVGLLVIIIGTYLGVSIRSGFGFLWDFIGSFLASTIGYGLLYLLGKVAWAILQKIPAGYIGVLVSGFITATFFLVGVPREAILYFLLGIVTTEVLLGALAYEFLKGHWRTAKRHKQVSMMLGLILVVAVNVGLFVWLVHPGVDDYLLAIEPFQGPPRVIGSNPSEPGPFEVKTLFYGSGSDRHRPEYGESVDIVTESVDGSPYLWFDELDGRIRELYWGFGPKELPINARVWYPNGEGPFPLVLIVHGNHYMIDPSDPGYGYLGELLASRGYIFVSIDENFLNGYLTFSVKWENDARAWLILKHLDIWRDWYQKPGSPFFGLVDINQIALVGHSRGGEAVALAAAFNHLSHYPDNGNFRWNFDFDIQSVIAIAPVDQQFKPADHPNQLTDVNYLVLQGAHDADVSKFDGYRQYQRVVFSDSELNKFKAGLYIYTANHSQFNSVWGLRDYDLPRGPLLNQLPIISPESQRQIASLYISAFLDATLKGNNENVSFFEDYRNAGNWLPPTLYINQFQGAGFLPVADFEEDFDVISITLEGGNITTHRLATWKEEDIKFRTGTSQNNHAVVLGWNRSGAWYKITIPQYISNEIGLSDNDYLTFNLADGRGLIEDGDLLDFTILLEDAYGESTSILLSEVNRLLPQLPVRFTKLPSWEDEDYKNSTEVVFQTFRIPIFTFLADNPQFTLDALETIGFVFDQSDSGTIILDEVGLDVN